MILLTFKWFNTAPKWHRLVPLSKSDNDFVYGAVNSHEKMLIVKKKCFEEACVQTLNLELWILVGCSEALLMTHRQNHLSSADPTGLRISSNLKFHKIPSSNYGSISKTHGCVLSLAVCYSKKSLQELSWTCHAVCHVSVFNVEKTARAHYNSCLTSLVTG